MQAETYSSENSVSVPKFELNVDFLSRSNESDNTNNSILFPAQKTNIV